MNERLPYAIITYLEIVYYSNLCINGFHATSIDSFKGIQNKSQKGIFNILNITG